MGGSLLLLEIEVSFSGTGGLLLQPFQSTFLSMNSPNKKEKKIRKVLQMQRNEK
jgi:hypothetical protein